MRSTSSSLQTTTPHPPNDDAQQRILIASFVGVAVVLVMILLFAIYCYNKRHPIQHESEYVHRHGAVSGTPPTYVYVNKGLQQGDQDSSEQARDVSIKLKIQWDDTYENQESEKFKTLQDQIIESMDDLYQQYCEFRGAILLKLRKGSVIADIRLKFGKLAVEPLNLIRSAVAVGRCSSFEVERDYFYVKERRSRQSRSDKVESGYGSQTFENISFVDRSQETRVCSSSENSPKSTSELAPDINSAGRNMPPPIHTYKSEHRMDSWSSSHRVKTKKKYVTNPEDQEGRHFIARFDFQPQDYRELALKQGDLVRISCTDVGGWVKVLNANDKEGWVPRNFIVEIDADEYVTRKKAVESIIFLDQMIESAADVEGEEDELEHQEQPNTAVKTYKLPSIKIKVSGDHVITETAAIVTSSSAAAAYENCDLYSEENLGGVFVAIFPFDPTDSKELQLEVGDFVDVSRTSETGWWKGRCMRTGEMGWFPSTYVKPKSADINFQSFFGDMSRDMSHVEESVSDSELQSSKRSEPIMNGYYSDGEDNQIQDKFMLRGSASENSVSFEDEEVEESEGFKKDGNNNLSPRPPKLHPSSGSFPQTQPPAPKRTMNHSVSSEILCTYAYNNDIIAINPAEPPAKPVPPKPRKQHIKQTYQKLAAKGQLCSKNEMLSRSLESLRVRPKLDGRRFSEDPDEYENKKMCLQPIGKDRPLSFQGAPRFVQLANRYASNMKGALSLPSLNGDQIKLSPDDDRPYLDPIPRKNKTSSVELLDSQIRSGDITTDEYIELTPPPLPPERSKSAGAEDTAGFNEKVVSLILSNENGVYTPTATVDDAVVKRSKEAPPKPQRESLKYGFAVRLASNGGNSSSEEKTQCDSFEENSSEQVSLPQNDDIHLATCSNNNDEKCDCGLPSNTTSTDLKNNDDVFTKAASTTCIRYRNSNARNFPSFESINEEASSENAAKKDVLANNNEKLSTPTTTTIRNSRKVKNSPQITLSINDYDNSSNIETSPPLTLSNNYIRSTFPNRKQTSVSGITSSTDDSSLPTVEPRTSGGSHSLPRKLEPRSPGGGPPPKLEPRCYTLPLRLESRFSSNSNTTNITLDASTSQPFKNKHKLYFRKINSFGEEESEEDTVSRASSTLSLSSFNSSNASRSTTSSKHEQMNLRKAITNVDGEGSGKDFRLSFKSGAILYELRPRNKEGFCYGLLEDSTEGWYPAEAVEMFNASLQV